MLVSVWNQGEPEMDCLFCKIVAGKIPAAKVYEDDEVLGFKDIQPQAPVHYLFVPKSHVDSLAALKDADLQILGKVFGALKKVATEAGLERGYRTVMNVNREGGQTVYHLHVHLLGGRQLGGNMTGV